MPPLTEHQIHEQLKGIFRQRGPGAQKEALEKAGISETAFRTARSRKRMRVSDLLAILEALEEDPVRFFEDAASESDETPGAFLLPKDLATRPEKHKELFELEELRFDEPFRLLRELQNREAEFLQPSLRSDFHGIAGSCYRLLEQTSAAEQHFGASLRSAKSLRQLASAMQRRSYLFWPDRILATVRHLDRASALFQQIGDDRALAEVAVERALAASLSRCHGVALELGQEALRKSHRLSARYKVSAFQVCGRSAAELGNRELALELYREAAAQSCEDRYTRGNLHWSFAKIESREEAEEQYLEAIEAFGEVHIFFSVCCGIEMIREGIGDPLEIVRLLAGLAESSMIPAFADFLLTLVGCNRYSRSVSWEGVMEAAQQVWVDWRAAKLKNVVLSLPGQ